MYIINLSLQIAGAWTVCAELQMSQATFVHIYEYTSRKIFGSQAIRTVGSYNTEELKLQIRKYCSSASGTAHRFPVA
jgi:hypothetical protein